MRTRQEIEGQMEIYASPDGVRIRVDGMHKLMMEVLLDMRDLLMDEKEQGDENHEVGMAREDIRKALIDIIVDNVDEGGRLRSLIEESYYDKDYGA